MPTASTQPHRSGQRHTQIAGGASSSVEKSANWVRIISGVSESDSRFTSRIDSATVAALASATRAPSCRLPSPGCTITSTPDEAHDGGAPAPPAHLLAGDQGGHHHGEQRLREGDRRGVGQRQHRHGIEAQHHRGGAHQGAPEMAGEALGMPRLDPAGGDQGQQQDHRDDGAEERGLHALDLRRQQTDHRAGRGEDEAAGDQPQRTLHVGRQASQPVVHLPVHLPLVP